MLLSVLLVAAAGAAASVLELDLNRINIEDLGGLGLERRATYIEKLANNITGGGYYVDFTVGTPPQPQRMVLDTGSSDIWVVANDADLCTSTRLQLYHGDNCAFVYDRTRSSTYTLKQRRGFSITYLDGTASKGDYFTDTLQIANFTLQNLQMGVASTTIRGTGVMGIGYSNHVAAPEPYPNIIDELVNQKVIAIKAYSLYLNDRRSSSGTILFGGVDTEKFIGTMSVVPIIPDFSTRTISTFTVAMSGLSFSFGNGTSGNVTMPATTVPSLLDSGTTLSYLPAALAQPLFNAIGAWTDSPMVTGYTYIDCKHLRQRTGLTINFSFAGGPTIVVPAYELVLDVVRFNSDRRPPGIPFTDICLFGIQSTATFASQSSRLANSNFVLLGDTFLRSAYVVYDLTHTQIGLAQANLNSTKSNIVELAASTSGLPALSGVKVQEPASGTNGGGGGGAVPTVTVTAAPNPPNAVGRTAPGLLAVAMLGALASMSGIMSLI